MKKTTKTNSSETPVKKEKQLSTESSENTNNDTQSAPSNSRVIDVTDEWLGKSIIIVGAPPRAKAGPLGETSVRQENPLPTESSDAARADSPSAQSNPFSDPCFTDNTEEMLGRHMAIVGAPPPAK